MHIVLSIILFAIFSLLALLHFYWAAGGRWGFYTALPTDAKGELKFEPGAMASAIVGAGLLFLAISYVDFIWTCHGTVWITIKNYLGFGVAVIFFMRAIGDFNLVGFFKKIKHTKFGKKDSSFYSPLCLLISILALAVELLN